MSTDLAKYASIVASLMRLTIEKKLVWHHQRANPLIPSDADFHTATYKGRDFILSKGGVGISSGSGSPLAELFGNRRYRLRVEGGTDEALSFPPMQAVDDLAALVIKRRDDALDELADLLK